MSAPRSVGRVVGSFRWFYAVMAWVLVVAVVMQFFLAGVGGFAPGSFCDPASNDSFACGFSLHLSVGRGVLPLLVVLVLVPAFAARAPPPTTALTAALLGLLAL